MTRNEETPLNTSADRLPNVVEFDAAAFTHFLDDTDWSDEEKTQYIALVWQIIGEFVALGWGVHPVQQAQEACGKLPKTGTETPILRADVVEWRDQDQANTFNAAADHRTTDAAERIQE